MKLEVLLSCMHQKDFEILNNFNVKSDVLIINQCDENNYKEKIINGNLCRMISTSKKGLSQSRNELLNNMNGDIGILCDDDVIYYDNYNEVILEAFNKNKKADVIIFDMDWINNDKDEVNLNKKNKNTKIIIDKNIKFKRGPKFKHYRSVTIAFKKESIRKKIYGLI